MKFYYIAQYYSPEPYLKDLQFTKDLQSALNTKLEVITGFPCYPYGRIYYGYKNRRITKELVEGIEVTRLLTFPYHGRSLFKRILNYFVFAFTVSLYVLFKGKSNAIYYIQQSSPFVVMIALTIRLFKRKSIIILDVQDVFPENIEASGLVTNIIVVNFLYVFIRFYYRIFDGIICVSDAVTLAVKQKLGKRRILVRSVFNWFISEGEEKAVSDIKFSLIHGAKIKIVYAGNIGVNQSLESLSSAIEKITNDLDVSFHFIGSGTSLEELKQVLENNSDVHFYGRVSPEEAFLGMLQSDILFLHLKRSKGYDRIIPSKLQAYLYCNKPILAGVCGEAALHIENSKAGKVFEPQNVEEFTLKTKELIYDIQSYKRGCGKAYYYAHFSREKGITKILDIVNELRDK